MISNTADKVRYGVNLFSYIAIPVSVLALATGAAFSFYPRIFKVLHSKVFFLILNLFIFNCVDRHDWYVKLVMFPDANTLMLFRCAACETPKPGTKPTEAAKSRYSWVGTSVADPIQSGIRKLVNTENFHQSSYSLNKVTSIGAWILFCFRIF